MSIVTFLSLHPSLDTSIRLYMLENFSAIAQVSSQLSADELTVQLWSNVITQHNSEGDWHGIDLCFHKSGPSGLYYFQSDIRPTSDGLFEYTYRARLNSQPDQWQWCGGFQNNGQLQVQLPAPGAQWTQGPSCVEILPSVYVGNFIAASQAESLGIDAVLNMGEELNLIFAPDSGITYCKLGTRDGAQHPIADELIQRAIAWIEQQRQQGKRKILIHCRAGIGRSGSIGVAYCFHQHPDWNYQQALDYAWSKKPDIYPHRHLQDSLERLFPRSGV